MDRSFFSGRIDPIPRKNRDADASQRPVPRHAIFPGTGTFSDATRFGQSTTICELVLKSMQHATWLMTKSATCFFFKKVLAVSLSDTNQNPAPFDIKIPLVGMFQPAQLLCKLLFVNRSTIVGRKFPVRLEHDPRLRLAFDLRILQACWGGGHQTSQACGSVCFKMKGAIYFPMKIQQTLQMADAFDWNHFSLTTAAFFVSVML